MVTLRRAVPEDVTAIQAVHKESIQRVASAFYPTEVIHAWSSRLGLPETLAAHESAIRAGSELVIVAEEAGEILGFGAIIPNTGELRAVYVGSSAKRCGIGSKILAELERIAKSLGLREIHMDSSLSAEAFYKKHGFQELARKKHKLSSGHDMDCVVMKKLLAST